MIIDDYRILSECSRLQNIEKYFQYGRPDTSSYSHLSMSNMII